MERKSPVFIAFVYACALLLAALYISMTRRAALTVR